MTKASRRSSDPAIVREVNSLAYLDAAIKSILPQTFADFELVNIGDGNTEGFMVFLRTLAERYPDWAI